MGDNTKIEWTDATWNPITGCDIESPGCTHCYAMTLAGTRLRNHPSRAGLTKRAANGAYVWNGEVRFNKEWIDQPVRWQRPRMVFVVAHGDLFHKAVPDEWIDDVFAIMALANWHTYQILTKRSARMAEYMAELYAGRMYEIAEKWREAGFNAQSTIMKSFADGLPHCWLGVSAEDQKHFDKRVKHLMEIPASVRWVSAEPLLGPILAGDALKSLSWIVCGGESGTRARPMHSDWVRSLRDECVTSVVPFLFKQWGTFIPADQPESRNFVYDNDRCEHVWDESSSTGYSIRVGKKAAGRLLDGRTWDQFPQRERE